MPKPKQPVSAPQPASRLERISDRLDAAGARIPEKLRTPLCMLIALVIALCMYFAGHGSPAHAFWDENYHVTSAQRYLDGIGFLESHPPLGKLLIAAGEKLTGDNATVDKSVFDGTKYINGDAIPPAFSFAGMRMMPSLFGALGALLFLGLMIELTGSRLTGLLFSSLYLFENAWIVHFRAVHLDSFQMFFCLGALWVFVRMWKSTQPLTWRAYAAMATLCGLGIMVKVNAALLLVLFPVIYFRDGATRAIGFRVAAQARNFALKAGVSVLAIVVVTAIVMSLHALIAAKPPVAGSAGDTDKRFMSQTYQDYLAGRHAFGPSTLLAVTQDYFTFMNHDHRGVPKYDACKPGENGSPPLHWPLHDKTINYRWDSSNGMTRYVQLAGNQLSWYLGLAGVLLSLLTIANRRIFKVEVGNDRSYALIEVFTGLYVIFMLLHLYLGAQRVMYLYHYFIGLLISYVLLVLNWQNLCALHEVRTGMRRLLAAALALAILASCLFFLPLSNHWPLSKQQCEMRNVFSRIVSCQG